MPYLTVNNTRKIINKVFFRSIILLLIILSDAFYEGTLGKVAEAQQQYPAPVVSTISPGGAEVGKSAELSILGKYFLQGAKLSFSPPTGISVNWVKVLSPEKISAGITIAKDAATGLRDVAVTNPDGQLSTLKGGFAVKTAPAPLPPPSLAMITPSSAEPGQALELAISGNNFQKGAKLSFSPPAGISVSQVKVLSPEKISAGITIAKDAATGLRDVAVTNPDGRSYTAKSIFQLKAVVLPYAVIAKMPAENKIQQLRKSLHRLITDLKNKASNWLEGFKIRMTDKASDEIRDSAFSEIKPSAGGTTPCLEPATVNYQTLHVSSPKPTGKRTIDSGPDGSVSHPFPNIAEALARAGELNYEGVEIIAGRGTYTGNLIITRPTKITGDSRTGTIIVGSIINHSIYNLTVNSLSINGPKTMTGEAGGEGALIISNACASTTLEHINIKSPSNYGVLQNGGRLSARDVIINDTAASANVASSGTAIQLSNVEAILNGIRIERAGRFAIRQVGGSLHIFAATIRDTKTRDEFSRAGTGIWTSDGAKTEILSSIISGSQSSALIIEGRQTEAFLKHVTIYDTEVNPRLMQGHLAASASDLSSDFFSAGIFTTMYPSAFASVEVQQEARLTMERSSISNNEYIGLRVGDNSQARIAYTNFCRTTSVPGSAWGGGINIQAKNNGYIYLDNVITMHADLAGLQLYDGTADYHIGKVSYNLTGVHITTEGFDSNRLMDGVEYSYNERNLDTRELPVPESGAPSSD
jgi:hypothetical protein